VTEPKWISVPAFTHSVVLKTVAFPLVWDPELHLMLSFKSKRQFVNRDPSTSRPHLPCLGVQLVQKRLYLPQRIICSFKLWIYLEVIGAEELTKGTNKRPDCRVLWLIRFWNLWSDWSLDPWSTTQETKRNSNNLELTRGVIHGEVKHIILLCLRLLPVLKSGIYDEDYEKWIIQRLIGRMIGRIDGWNKIGWYLVHMVGLSHREPGDMQMYVNDNAKLYATMYKRFNFRYWVRVCV